MPWNSVISNIVTQDVLDAAVANTYSTANLDAKFDNKLNVTGGIATNLQVDVAGTPSPVVTSSQLVIEVADLNASINSKASLTGATFTGNVKIPNGVASNDAVNLGQLQLYLPLTGGVVSGNISAASAPSTGDHLTNKTYVDGQIATCASSATVTTLDSVKADKTELTKYADTTAPVVSFTGTVSVPTQAQGTSSNAIANCSFVATEIAALRDYVDGVLGV